MWLRWKCLNISHLEVVATMRGWRFKLAVELVVFFVLDGILLILLTILTVGLTFLNAPPIRQLVLGLTIAGIKTSLVVVFLLWH
jgi:hypothetical protein